MDVLCSMVLAQSSYCTTTRKGDRQQHRHVDKSNQHYKIIQHVLEIITRTVKTKILTTEMKPQYESENHNYNTEATVPAQDLQHKPPLFTELRICSRKGKKNKDSHELLILR